MEIIGLIFDRYTMDNENKFLAKGQFVHMLLNSIGQDEQRSKNELNEQVKLASELYEMCKVFPRNCFPVPGKDHPYLYRKECTSSSKKKSIQKILPAEIVDEDLASDSICLHEILLLASYCNRQQCCYQYTEFDDVAQLFFLFDSGLEMRISQGEFANMLRVLMVGLYVSDYEGKVAIPLDCDPIEKETEMLRAEDTMNIAEIEHTREARIKLAAKKSIIDRMLDVLFDEIDKAKVNSIDTGDMDEWLRSHPHVSLEFIDRETGNLNSAPSFASVGVLEGQMNREQFYAMIENTHVFCERLNDQLELQLFDLCCKVAIDDSLVDESGFISLARFRKFLRDSADRRIAELVIRVSRALRSCKSTFSEGSGNLFLRMIKYHKTKPRFQNFDLKGTEKSNALKTLRQEYARKSPLEVLRISPLNQ